MTRTVEFFYDYVSLYSYLANSQLKNLEAEIVYRPMYLGAVLQATGNSPPLTVKAKGKYLFKDVSRWAAHYEIPYRMNPVFPQNTVNALRLALVAQEQGVFDAVHELLFDAMWAFEKDLSDSNVLAEVATGAGLPVDEILSEIVSDRIKDRLRENTDEAIHRGAFGAPTLYVDDEMFFGNDRFEFVEKALNA